MTKLTAATLLTILLFMPPPIAHPQTTRVRSSMSSRVLSLDIYGSIGIRTHSGIKSARASADPGFQANAILHEGDTLTWSFDENGALASRTIVWPDANSRGELYSPSGQYKGTTITGGTGTGSTITRTYNAAGVEIGHSITTPATPMGMAVPMNSSIVTTQYGATIRGGSAMVVSRSVKTTSANSDGTFVTTHKVYATRQGAATEQLIKTTITETRGNRAVSTDYASTGRVLGRRILVANPDKSSTLTNIDDRGTVLGSAKLSMNTDGTVVLKVYDSAGRLGSVKTLTTDGVMTVTSYQAGRIAGRDVWTPTAVGGDVTSYFSATGTKLGDWWIAPDGTYGSDRPRPNGASVGVTRYRDSSLSRIENNGRGQMTITYFSSKGVQIGAAAMASEVSGITSRYLSIDGVARTQLLVDGNGEVRATADLAGGRAIGFSLTRDRNFSRLVIEGGATTAYNFDDEGSFVGKSGTSKIAFSRRRNAPTRAAAGKVVVLPGQGGQIVKEEFYPNGTMSGYELESLDTSGAVRVTAYDLEGYVQESIILDSSGVICRMLGITSSGVVTTTWQTDGSYQQVTDNGEGDVTTTSYSAAGEALSDHWKRSNGTSGKDVYDVSHPSPRTHP